MEQVTEKDIGDVLSSLVSRQDAELFSTAESDLGKFWTFRFDATKSHQWNLYQFSDRLESFKRQMRRWEEKHHGSMCVVERVRDKYLMPRITEFLEHLKAV